MARPTIVVALLPTESDPVCAELLSAGTSRWPSWMARLTLTNREHTQLPSGIRVAASRP